MSPTMITRSLLAGLVFFCCVCRVAAYTPTKKRTPLKSFQLWLVDREADFPLKIEEKADKTGFRYIITDDYDRDENIISFPTNLLITPETVRKSRLSRAIRAIEKKGGKLPEDELFALYLVYERNRKASSWAPFMRVVPNKYWNAYYVTDEQMAELGGTYTATILAHAQKRLKSLQARIDAVKPRFPKVLRPSKFTLDNLRWGMSVARQGLFAVNHSNYTAFLIPGATLMGHSTEAQLGWTFVGQPDADGNGQHFAAFSLRELEEGEELFMKFGNRSNAQLVADYGELVEGNPDDFLPISMAPKADDGLTERKTAALKKFKLDARSHSLKPGVLSEAMLKSTRVIAAKEADLARLEAGDADPEFLGNMNEELAISNLKDAIESLLGAYSTTKAEDEKLLSRADLPKWKATFIQLRLNEKRLVEESLELLEKHRVEWRKLMTESEKAQLNKDIEAHNAEQEKLNNKSSDEDDDSMAAEETGEEGGGGDAGDETEDDGSADFAGEQLEEEVKGDDAVAGDTTTEGSLAKEEL